jgi:hypothetical protein
MMNKLLRFSLFAFPFVLLSCSQQQRNPEQSILEKSIAFHDPSNQWETFRDSFKLTSNSKWSEWKDEHLQIMIDVPHNTVKYHNIEKKVKCLFEQDSSFALIDSCDCSPYNSWTKDFYTYIWGLPMKLKDPKTTITQLPNKIMFFEDSCYVLQTEYSNEQWEYYISDEDYYLAGFRFEKKDGSGGEIVRNVGIENWNGINTPLKRVWFELNESLVGTDVFSK